MKKILPILGLTLLSLNSFSQEHPKIERKMIFKFEDFEKFFFYYREPEKINPKNISIFYDLNQNGKPDMMATYEVKGTVITNDTIVYRTKTKANGIYLDKNEDGKVEEAFCDYDEDKKTNLETKLKFDKNGILEKRIPEPKKENPKKKKEKEHATYMHNRWT